MNRVFVGLDVGTTATKAVLVTGEGSVLERVRVAHGPSVEEAGRADPEAWWTSVKAACSALEIRDNVVQGIGLSVNCPVAIPMDDAGAALAAGYRYDSPQMSAAVEDVRAKLTTPDKQRTGNRVFPATFIAAAYLLMKDAQPALASKTKTLGAVGSFIGHRLTGVAAIDPSQASYFGPFDTTGDWNWCPEILERLRIPPEILPEVVPSKSTIGALTEEAAEALGLRDGIPVTAGAGDTACAVYGAGVDDGNALLLTLGTTHVVTDHRNRPSCQDIHLQRAHVADGQWLLHGATNGGAALSVGAGMLGYGTGGDAVPRMLEKADKATAQDIARAPFFIPHVRAERGPLWLDSPAGAFLGITSETDSIAAAWSVVEGVLFGDRLVFESFLNGSGEDRPVILAGGTSGSDVFVQLTADLLGTAINVSNESHLSAVGAALLAMEHRPHNFGRRAEVSITPRPAMKGIIADRWPRFCAARTNYIGTTLR